jgi:hypothetical protein
MQIVWLQEHGSGGEGVGVGEGQKVMLGSILDFIEE